MVLSISHLAGVFTGVGFVEKGGRRILPGDCGFLPGPLHIRCDEVSGRILEITPSTEQDDPGAREIDAAGLFATAGFIDSHTHSVYAGQRCGEAFLRWQGASYLDIAGAGGGIGATVRRTGLCTDAALGDLLRRRLRRMARLGATTVEVKSGYGGSPEGEMRLLGVIRDIRQEGGVPDVVPTFLGLHALPTNVPEREYCNSMIAMLPTLREAALARYVDVFPERGFFSLEESLRFVDAARMLGLGFRAHADELTDMGAAAAFADLGAASVDHLVRTGEKGIETVARSETVATLLPSASFFLRIPFAPARRLIRAGAIVALATDHNPGSAPVEGFQTTMLLAAAELGMLPHEILCACTYAPAVSLGLGESRGSLMPGRLADVLLWEVESDHGAEGTGVLEEIIAGKLVPQEVILRGRPLRDQLEQEAGDDPEKS